MPNRTRWIRICDGLLDQDGVRVDSTTVPRDEWDGLAESCGWQNDDLLLAKDENPPEKDGFACPNCGGNDFTWLGIPEGDPDGD